MTVHSAYLPTLAVLESTSTNTNLLSVEVTSSIQSDWLVNVVIFVIGSKTPLDTLV